MTLPDRDIELLKANHDVRQTDIELAEKIDKDDLHTTTDEELLRVRDLIKEVGREIHKMKGFVRFKQVGKKLKYGYMKLENHIGFMVSEWFADRFPGIVIVLGNEKESWVSIRTEKGVESEKSGDLKSTVEKLAEMLGAETEKDFQDLWENYYESQYADERKNLELFEKNMPRKYRKRARNTTEERFYEEGLDEYE